MNLKWTWQKKGKGEKFSRPRNDSQFSGEWKVLTDEIPLPEPGF
jgi:hypothetical protein